MTRLRMVLWRLRALFRRNTLDHQFSDEIQSHIDMLAADNVRAGMPPEDARQAAVRAFGGVEQVKERHRDARTFALFEQTWSDIRHSIRSLGKNPAFTVFASSTLIAALCRISLSVAIENDISIQPLNSLPFRSICIGKN